MLGLKSLTGRLTQITSNGTGKVFEDTAAQQLFQAISSYRRRYVLLVLDAHGETSVSNIAERIAAHEYCDEDVDQPNSVQRKRVYVSLYQCHLDRMADTDLIDYDKRAKVIAPTERTGDVAEYIRRGQRLVGDDESIPALLA